MAADIRIGIVGGGAAGVSVLSQLITKLEASGFSNQALLVFIHKDRCIGPGVAYGTNFDSNILNMRYQKMSILAEDPDHITNWIRRTNTIYSRYPDFDPDKDGFPPRSLFGMYLEDTLRAAIQKAESCGIQLRFIHDEVVDIEAGTNDLELRLKYGRSVRSDKVVLALGNFPATTYKHLRGNSGYFDSFWPDLRTIESVASGETVIILGTRLTAIDAALTTLSCGHKGKVILVSRGGLLPKVQAGYPALTAPYRECILRKVSQVTKSGEVPLRLADLIKIIREEIEHAHYEKIDWDKVLNQSGTALQILQQDIANARKYKLNWQGVLSSTSDIIEDLWHMMPDSDKQEFIEKYNSIWFVYRHCMPLKNADRLLRYLESGQLEVHGGLREVRYDSALKMFEIQCQNAEGSLTQQSRYLINATDVGLDIEGLDSPLVKNLLQSGLMKPSPFGGIDVDFETCRLVGTNKQLSDRLYSIGYLTKGVHFYTNDVARIASHALRVVNDLIAQLPAASDVVDRLPVPTTIIRDAGFAEVAS